MIGFVRIADIPGAIIGLVIGIASMIGLVLVPLTEFPSLMRRIPDWIFVLICFSLMGVSYAVGNRIWEWNAEAALDSPFQTAAPLTSQNRMGRW